MTNCDCFNPVFAPQPSHKTKKWLPQELPVLTSVQGHTERTVNNSKHTKFLNGSRLRIRKAFPSNANTLSRLSPLKQDLLASHHQMPQRLHLQASRFKKRYSFHLHTCHNHISFSLSKIQPTCTCRNR